MADNIVGVVGTRDDGCEVVCTLPEASLGERAAMVEREILPHVRDQRRTSDGFELSFAADSDVRAKLEHWAELERRCCQEARFEIAERADGLHLSVHGIDPKSNALATMLDGRSTPENPILRIAKAGGIGALGSFFLLCVVPMGIVAVAGASVAAPLARLESPPTLAVGALLVGGGWWLWRRRSSRSRAQPDAGCGC